MLIIFVSVITKSVHCQLFDGSLQKFYFLFWSEIQDGHQLNFSVWLYEQMLIFFFLQELVNCLNTKCTWIWYSLDGPLNNFSFFVFYQKSKMLNYFCSATTEWFDSKPGWNDPLQIVWGFFCVCWSEIHNGCHHSKKL